MRRSVVIKATVGTGALKRCFTAFELAANQTSSATVSLWLAGDATMFAKPEREWTVNPADLRRIRTALDVVLRDGKVTLCAQCAQRHHVTPSMLAKRVRIAGPAVFVEECLAEGAQALVY